MLIKDNDGDWGICVATWRGMTKGKPGVPGKIILTNYLCHYLAIRLISTSFFDNHHFDNHLILWTTIFVKLFHLLPFYMIKMTNSLRNVSKILLTLFCKLRHFIVVHNSARWTKMAELTKRMRILTPKFLYKKWV
jgi:hypothetical protein